MFKKTSYNKTYKNENVASGLHRKSKWEIEMFLIVKHRYNLANYAFIRSLTLQNKNLPPTIKLIIKRQAEPICTPVQNRTATKRTGISYSIH